MIKTMPCLLEKPEEVSKDHYLIKIDIGQSISQPGQFANIRIGEIPLLRRPFSIYDHNSNIIKIIFKVIGKGTGILKDFNPGNIDVIAPLGSGFSICENKKVLLAGGGVGNAPLYYLAKNLKTKGNSIHYIYAAKAKEFIYNKNEYRSVSDVFHIATDDGSEGFKGIAADAVREILRENNFDMVYTCGPSIMMKSIAGLFSNSGTPIEVSVENYFGCGVGLCFGCTIETTAGFKRACMDGPVFDGRIIKWDALG